jgi:hypothetical protein
MTLDVSPSPNLVRHHCWNHGYDIILLLSILILMPSLRWKIFPKPNVLSFTICAWIHQCVITMMVFSLFTAEESVEEHLISLFKRSDLDGNGSLDMKEFEQVGSIAYSTFILYPFFFFSLTCMCVCSYC